MDYEMDKAILKYIPKSKRDGVKSCFRDSDGIWIWLKDGWNADRMDSDCHVIREDYINDLKYQIAGIRKVVRK